MFKIDRLSDGIPLCVFNLMQRQKNAGFSGKIVGYLFVKEVDIARTRISPDMGAGRVVALILGWHRMDTFVSFGG